MILILILGLIFIPFIFCAFALNKRDDEKDSFYNKNKEEDIDE